MPLLSRATVKNWYKKHSVANSSKSSLASAEKPGKKVYLFCDEFTNHTDAEIGIRAILLLEALGYTVVIPDHVESGRAWLSKGLLREAKKIANKNIRALAGLINEDTPLIGIEPSAILTFRDEYVDLADESQFEIARQLSKNVFLIDEFITREKERGHISTEVFTKEKRNILLHGHCQQKALSSVSLSKKMLSLAPNYSVRVIPSGCCGMAGSFGYEKEHYDLSMKIGELVLFPAVRNKSDDTIVAAPGTSCRHQIRDGTGVRAMHPVEILYDALAKQF
jgi:Fe-S oxidoreductase